MKVKKYILQNNQVSIYFKNLYEIITILLTVLILHICLFHFLKNIVIL
jgi:hypothetical protein